MKIRLAFGFLFFVSFSCLSAAVDDGFKHGTSKSEDEFLRTFWSEQTSFQGEAPKTYSKLESSLDPEDCGFCHQSQHADWKKSLHSKGMGPGVLGQIVDMVQSDPETAKICWRCHTPLLEQQDVVLKPGAGWEKNENFQAQLQAKGLICAACHVRNHKRYGPPPSVTTSRKIKKSGGLAHGGFSSQSAYTKSEFCKVCHQFNEGDYALNGKLIENTFNEWQQSRYAKEGVQCQDCHMPERKHLWKGIHDIDMVKRGITVHVDYDSEMLVSGDTLKAKISIKNTGVGHYFPTYITPMVFVNAYLADKQGRQVQGSLRQAVIGRETTLNLSEELFDTRIAPDETMSVVYQMILENKHASLVVKITVEPDHFYEKFYEATLASGSARKGKELIKQALENSKNSKFEIFYQVYPLNL